MTSKHEARTDPESKPKPTSSEAAYDRLAGYAVARRYVEGKVVADVGWTEVGHGTSLLAETAGFVVGMAGSPEAVASASTSYPAPNVGYERVDLPTLPYPDDHFDVVVALGVIENLEHLEGLVGEAKRVLKQDGVLVVSVPDKQALASGRRGLYEPEFREMLRRHFEYPRLYRQGAVAGGFVFPVGSGQDAGTPVEVARLSPGRPRLGEEPPITRYVLAVCGGAEASRREEGPYLLLDRDRGVFDEREKLAEQVELLRAEIRQMQETEVQAFLDTISLRKNVIAEVGRYLFHLRNYRVHLRRVAAAVERRLSRKRSADGDRRSD